MTSLSVIAALAWLSGLMQHLSTFALLFAGLVGIAWAMIEGRYWRIVLVAGGLAIGGAGWMGGHLAADRSHEEALLRASLAAREREAAAKQMQIESLEADAAAAQRDASAAEARAQAAEEIARSVPESAGVSAATADKIRDLWR